MLLGNFNIFNFDASEGATFSIEVLQVQNSYVIDVEVYEANNYSQAVMSESLAPNENSIEILSSSPLENGKDYRVRARINDGVWTSMHSFSCRNQGSISLSNSYTNIRTSSFQVDPSWNQSQNVLPKVVKAWLEIDGKRRQYQEVFIENALPSEGGTILVKEEILSLPKDVEYSIDVLKSHTSPIRISFLLEGSDTPQSVAFKIANRLKAAAKIDFTLSGAMILTRVSDPFLRVDYSPVGALAGNIDADSLIFKMPVFDFERETQPFAQGSVNLEIISQYDMTSSLTTPLIFEPSDIKIAGAITVGQVASLGANLLHLSVTDALNTPLTVLANIKPNVESIVLKRREMPIPSEAYTSKVDAITSTDELERHILKSEFSSYSEEQFEQDYPWLDVGVLENTTSLNFANILFVDQLINSEARYEYVIEFIMNDQTHVQLRDHRETGANSFVSKFATPGIEYNLESVEVPALPFQADFISDGESTFKIDFNRKLSSIIDNTTIRTQPLLNNKFPAILRGEQRYKTGEITFRILSNQTLSDNKAQSRSQMNLTDQLLSFLEKDNNKLLRLKDGTCMVVQVTGSPSYSLNEMVIGLPQINFSFVEVKESDDLTDFIWRGEL